MVEFDDDVGRQFTGNRRQEARHQANRNKGKNLPAMTGLTEVEEEEEEEVELMEEEVEEEVE